MSGPHVVSDTASVVLRVAWVRFRATLKTRWASYAIVAVVVGILGGLAMAGVAAARRTQSSFTALLASTNPSDLGAITAVWNPSAGVRTGYDPAVIEKIRHLPGVVHVESYVGLQAFTVGADGKPMFAAQSTLGSVDGLLFNQDDVIITRGRMADPTKANEVVVTDVVARSMNVDVGATFPVLFFTDAKSSGPTQDGAPYLRIDATLVGIGQVSNTIVRDDADLPETMMLFTPALTKPLATCCSYLTASGLQLAHGSRDVAIVEAEIAAVLPPGVPHFFRVTSTAEVKAERAIKPESLALGVFGLIALVAALLIACQVIGRVTRDTATEVEVLRALGAGSATTATDSVPGLLAAIILGAVLAAAVAIGLSPVAPIGPVRRTRPNPGLDSDWTVLGVGAGLLIVVLGAAAVTFGLRQGSATPRPPRRHRSRAAHAAAVAGLPVSVVVGIDLALSPGSGRSAAPVRSAVIGVAVAVIVLTGTVTFAASADQLVSHPALYGWNWDLELFAGSNEMPREMVAAQLNADKDVASWTGYYFATLEIDGHNVPALGTEPRAVLAPPILTGHGLQAVHEIVLGASTLGGLHKHVGDTVQVTTETGTQLLLIVGTATMPTVGNSGGVHPTMGDGAVVDSTLIPSVAKSPFGDPTAGPQAIFIKLRPGVGSVQAFAALQKIAAGLFPPDQIGAQALTVQRPAEIVNYRSMGSTLRRLGIGVGGGALLALGLTLIATVRRRRRDFAILKALGFTNGAVAAAVAWHATTAAVCGIVVGMSFGVIGGRQLWLLFAQTIHAVPDPAVSTWALVFTAVGAVLLANLIAVIPSRIAARLNPAAALRAKAVG